MKKTNIEGMVYMRLTLERKKEIEQKAEKFRQGMDNEIIDTIILARAKGFEVSSATFHEENVDGGIIIRKENDTIIKEILFEDSLDDYQQRFIVAHELGHFALHYDENRINKKTAFLHVDFHKDKSEEEQEADYFATCILMPAEHFKNVYEGLFKRIGDPEMIISMLSQIFRVPLLVAKRRISEVYNR